MNRDEFSVEDLILSIRNARRMLGIKPPSSETATRHLGKTIPSPERCFGDGRPVEDWWDDYQYERYVIDNQSPDFHG